MLFEEWRSPYWQVGRGKTTKHRKQSKPHHKGRKRTVSRKTTVDMEPFASFTGYWRGWGEAEQLER